MDDESKYLRFLDVVKRRTEESPEIWIHSNDDFNNDSDSDITPANLKTKKPKDGDSHMELSHERIQHPIPQAETPLPLANKHNATAGREPEESQYQSKLEEQEISQYHSDVEVAEESQFQQELQVQEPAKRKRGRPRKVLKELSVNPKDTSDTPRKSPKEASKLATQKLSQVATVCKEQVFVRKEKKKLNTQKR